MNGFINVLKPPGMSSHDVVEFIRRTLGVKKAGHTGTLDPGAAGVLVICLGTATRLARFLLEDDKEYRTEITFGVTTSSADSYGDVVARNDASNLNENAVRSALPVFTGVIQQVPPMTSALKWKGKKLYQLARAGISVERPERSIKIYSLEFICGTGWGSPNPRALIHLTCSKGTYVRSLCNDLGRHLGYGAYMSFLVRTRAGSFSLKDSKTLEDIKNFRQGQQLKELIMPVDFVLSGLPKVLVNNGALSAVLSGSKLYLPGVAGMPEYLAEGDLVRLMGSEKLLAIAETALDPEDRDRLFFKPLCVLARQ